MQKEILVLMCRNGFFRKNYIIDFNLKFSLVINFLKIGADIYKFVIFLPLKVVNKIALLYHEDPPKTATLLVVS